MLTPKQLDSAISNTFKALMKISERKDSIGFNPYKDVFYSNEALYVTDSICMVKVRFNESLGLISYDRDGYAKANIKFITDSVRPMIQLYQDDQTEKMTTHLDRSHEHTFDRFFSEFFYDKKADSVDVDPKRLIELLQFFKICKIQPTIENGRDMIKLSGTNRDLCTIEAVLMGVRK